MALKVIEYKVQSDEEYQAIMNSIELRSAGYVLQAAIKAAGYFLPISELDLEKKLWTLHLARQDNDPLYNEDIFKIGMVIGRIISS